MIFDDDPPEPLHKPLNPEAKKQWLEALRSGKYQQGVGHLLERSKEGDKYCCLGVLCELKSDHKWGEAEENLFGYSGNNPHMSTEFPDTSVYTWANLDDAAAELLAEKNDAGETFSQIADWIEANL